MRTYVNTFSNVTTKVLTYSHLQSLTQGFGLGPKYATAGLDQNIFVQKYMINLPSVEDLTSYIEKETEKEIGRLSSAK